MEDYGWEYDYAQQESIKNERLDSDRRKRMRPHDLDRRDFAERRDETANQPAPAH